MTATDYTDGLAVKALQTIFEYLPLAYDNGLTDVEAREKMANAATMAGMAFANAPVKRWQTQPPWQVWPSPTLSWGYAIPWHISWAHSITLHTVLPTH